MPFTANELSAALSVVEGVHGQETSTESSSEGVQESQGEKTSQEESPQQENPGREDPSVPGEAVSGETADNGKSNDERGRTDRDGQVGEPTDGEQQGQAPVLAQKDDAEESWSKLLAQRSLLHKQEQIFKKRLKELEDRQSRLDKWEEDQRISAELRNQDPVEWLNRQNLPNDFFDRYIRKLNGEQQLEDPGVKAMRDEFQRLRDEVQQERKRREEIELNAQAEAQGRQWLEGLRGELAKPEYELVSKWPNIEHEAATLVVGWKNEYDEVLTHRQALDMLMPKIREYVERFTGSAPPRGAEKTGADHSPKAITNQAAAASAPVSSMADMPWDEQIAVALRKHGV